MKPLYAKVLNFGSYPELELQFQDDSLILISGPTGAGKSTLCDVLPWVLFGKTAKNGAADDVCSWHTNGATIGIAEVQVSGQRVLVSRTRGAARDLYFKVNFSEEIRGKDLLDTQKLLDQALRMDIDLYLASSYYQEFSQTAGFFTANAKGRRQLTEQLADLSLAKQLSERVLEEKREAVKTQHELEKSIESQKASLSAYDTALILEDARRSEAKAAYAERKSAKIKDLLNKFSALQDQICDDRGYIDAITGFQDSLEEAMKARCPTCGGPIHSSDVDSLKEAIRDQRQEQRNNKNLIEQLNRLEQEIIDLSAEIPPADPSNLAELQDKAATARKLLSLHSANLTSTRKAYADLDALSDVVSAFRTRLVTGTIAKLEVETNRFLSNHFDAEIKVVFSAADADKIEVGILKDGNACSFPQLSKGQRQLLKFSFGMAVVKVVRDMNAIGDGPLWIDEAFDGLSEEFKVKAFHLLSAMNKDYSTIYVVEHSQELKSLFFNQYKISLVDGRSTLEKT